MRIPRGEMIEWRRKGAAFALVRAWFLSAALIATLTPREVAAQSGPSGSPETDQSPASLRGGEIQLERCDRLPVIQVKIGSDEMRFLLDTGATSILNAKTFWSGKRKEVHIANWTGTTSTLAHEIAVEELSVGGRSLRDIKLSAIDLSPIAHACGGRIDGILGVDLLEQFGLTIDFAHNVARLGGVPAAAPASPVIVEMELAMSGCSEAFNRGEVGKLMECFDPEFVWDTPSVEFHGREQVVDFLAAHYFRSKSGAHFWMKVRDQQAVGNVVWTSYDFTIEGAGVHDSGRGMMICRKSDGQWHILSMHQSLDRPAAKCAGAE